MKKGKNPMKNQKTKHYIATINELNGDLEYDTKYLFKTSECPDKYNDKVASTWRGGNDYDEDAGGYWSDNSLMSAGEWKEIPASHFAILKKYLSVL
jgi:hypothetical protein